MKKAAIFTVFLLETILSYSQPFTTEDSTISFTSDQISVSFSPTDVIAKMTLSIKKLKDKSAGIEFSFVTTLKERAPSIHIDSIILTDSKDKILRLNNPYRDTIFYRTDGSLSLTIIHLLDKVQLNTLRQDNMKQITLNVDSSPITINLAKKFQARLREMINNNL